MGSGEGEAGLIETLKEREKKGEGNTSDHNRGADGGKKQEESAVERSHSDPSAIILECIMATEDLNLN